MDENKDGITPTRVMIVSHSAVVDVYQDKLRHIARMPGIELELIVPHEYFEAGRVVPAFRGDGSYKVTVLRGKRVREGRQNLFTLVGLRRAIKRFKPHIVHLEEEPESLITHHTIRACLRLRTPPRIVGFTWRNIPFPYPHWPWYHPKRLLLGVLQRINLPHYDALIMGSHDGALQFTQFELTCPTPIIPQYGINPNVYNPTIEPLGLRHSLQIPTGAFVVGFVGRVMKMKGLDTLIAACSVAGQDVHCVVVGRGPDTEWLKKIASDLRFERQLHFVDHLGPSEIPSAMRDLDIMVLPSRTAPHWKEQFGRVLVEAMACGVPVVGSSSGEIPFVIGNAGMVFEEGNSEQLAQRIVELRNSNTYSQFQQRGYERVASTYTNERIAQAICSVYHEVSTSQRKYQ